MQYILAIDNGSSGIRAMLFDHAGRIASRHYVKTPPILPEPSILCTLCWPLPLLMSCLYLY